MITEHPFFYTLITLIIFYIATVFYRRTGQVALLHPILLSIFTISICLVFFETPYSKYKAGTETLHFFLEPAIVALAIPLAQNLKLVRSTILPLIITVIIASGIIIISALKIGILAGFEGPTLLSLTTKSVSAPIALNISQIIESDTSLAIVAVFATGIPGVIITPTLFKIFKLESDMIKGFTFGITSHAFGVVRSSEISARATAFATLGMGLMGCISAFMIPVILKLFHLM